MARGLNKVMLIGNLGADPEVRYMPSGDAVANFSLATTDQWKDKQTGEKREATEWHKCNAFGRLAEVMQQYTRKGSKLYVEGSLHTRKWQDQSGHDRYSTEVRVRDMQMLDGASQGQQSAPPARGHGQGPEGYQRHQAAHAQRQGQAQGQAQGGFDDFDDEIPFD